jgi:Uma2 family endonuclease
MIQAPPRTMLEVFESLPEGTLCQLINNIIIMSPSPAYEHQQIAKLIFRQLDKYVDSNKLGEAYFAPFDVYLGKRNVYQPDILFISKERMNIIKDGKIKGAPDLIIEILSPSTAKFDIEDKKAVYEQYGVKEYWIVEPESKAVSGFTLTNQEYSELESTKGTIQSALLNLTISF